MNVQKSLWSECPTVGSLYGGLILMLQVLVSSLRSSNKPSVITKVMNPFHNYSKSQILFTYCSTVPIPIELQSPWDQRYLFKSALCITGAYHDTGLILVSHKYLKNISSSCRFFSKALAFTIDKNTQDLAPRNRCTAYLRY